MIDYTVDGDGIAHVVWNNVNAPVNIKNEASITAFIAAVDQAIGDAAVKGVVITSAKRDFLAGGDIQQLYEARSPAEAIDNLHGVGAALRSMERSGKPFVAALNGSALGGGLEVALACHRRIASDTPRLRVGLPEITLGLIPGAGGTQRLPRLIGIQPAARLLLEGRLLNAQDALQQGVIDEVVPEDQLLDRARAWLLDQPNCTQPWDIKGFTYPDFHPQSREGRWFFFYEWPKLRRRSPPEDLAPGTLLHVLAQGLERDIDAGLAIETRYFGMVAASTSAKNHIRTRFFAPNASRKQKRQSSDKTASPLPTVGVVGTGLMGSGIALVCARAGLSTMLIDTDIQISREAVSRIEKTLDGAVEKKLVSQEQRNRTLEKLRPEASFTALKDCDIVIEAVAESLDVKDRVLKQIEKSAKKGAMIASNTSTLSISRLAQSLQSPANFIGLHFFAPVDRMELVEVITGSETSDLTKAVALDFLQLVGKKPIVVRDGPGFYTSRVVAAYTREALTMLAEGVSPSLIDNAALIAGLPIGPLAMADLTSYDLLIDIISSLEKTGLGTAVESRVALAAAQRLVKAGRLGRKGDGGVYDYDTSGKVLWSGLTQLFDPISPQPAVAEVVQRLLHIQSLEAVHAIDEDIVRDPLAIDLAAVLGWSYPTFRGGVLAHMDDVGLDIFIAQCEVLAGRYGSRFRPPESLRRMAEAGTTFHTH